MSSFRQKLSANRAVLYEKTERNTTEPATSDDDRRRWHRAARRALAAQHVAQNGESWLHARRFAITASVAAKALHCEHEFPWARKRADLRPLDAYEHAELSLLRQSGFQERLQNSRAMQHGKSNEIVAMKSFVSRHQKDVLTVGLLLHKQYRWLGASPDGICCDDGSLIELKVPLSRSFRVGDPVMAHYWVQCQIQMEVCNVDKCFYNEYRVPSTSARARIKEPRINEQVVRRDRDWFGAALPLLRVYVEHLYRLHSLRRLYSDQ